MWLRKASEPSSHCPMGGPTQGQSCSLAGGLHTKHSTKQEVSDIAPLPSFIQADRFLFPVILRFKSPLPWSFLRNLFLLLNDDHVGGEKFLFIRTPLVFPWALGLRTLASLGAISFVAKLELMYSRHSCPGCPENLASSDSVQKCSHVRILLCLASTCLAGTPCPPPSCVY